MEDKILSIEEMAQALHIQPETMHSKKWQQKTGCPLIKKGKRSLALASEFLKWLKTRSNQSVTNA